MWPDGWGDYITHGTVLLSGLDSDTFANSDVLLSSFRQALADTFDLKLEYVSSPTVVPPRDPAMREGLLGNGTRAKSATISFYLTSSLSAATITTLFGDGSKFMVMFINAASSMDKSYSEFLQNVIADLTSTTNDLRGPSEASSGTTLYMPIGFILIVILSSFFICTIRYSNACSLFFDKIRVFLPSMSPSTTPLSASSPSSSSSSSSLPWMPLATTSEHSEELEMMEKSSS